MKLSRAPLATLATTLLCSSLVYESLGALDAYGQTPAETAAYQAALAANMDTFVHDKVTAYFTSMNLTPPEAVKVETRGSFAASQPGEAPSGEVAELALDVTLTTDQPSAVVREVRQQLARGLKDQGYRLETLEGVVDARPLAVFTLKTELPEPAALHLNGLKEYTTFGAILLGLIASLMLLLYLLAWPWRRRRRRLTAQRLRARQQQDAVAPPRPAMPEVAAMAQPAPADIPLAPAPLLRGNVTDVSPLAAAAAVTTAGPPIDAEVEALRRLPFEKVLDLLVAAEPTARRAMLDRLELNPPLKRRLEKELLSF